MADPISFVKAVNKFFGGISDNLDVSLSSFIKSTYITSRVYVDGTLAHEAVTSDVLKATHMLYCSYIMNAFCMNQYIASAKTIKEGITARDYLSIVSTESFTAFESIQEALEEADHYIIPKSVGDRIAKNIKELKAENGKLTEELKNEKEDKGSSFNISEKSISADNRLPAGRMLELDLRGPGKDSVKINLLVQMFPYIIGSSLITQFVTKDYVPSFLKRLVQLRVGEISFFSDFIANLDIVRKRNELLIKDQTGVVRDDMLRQAKNRARIVGNFKRTIKQRNLANSVIVLDKDTVDRVYAESGLNLYKANERQKYFAMSMTMILVVVDTMHNIADFYLNGIDSHGTYTFDQLKTKGKSDNGFDLVDFIKAMSRSQMPKF